MMVARLNTVFEYRRCKQDFQQWDEAGSGRCKERRIVVLVARFNVRTTWLGKVGCAWDAWNLPGLKDHGLHKVEPKWTRGIMVRLMMMA